MHHHRIRPAWRIGGRVHLRLGGTNMPDTLKINAPQVKLIAHRGVSGLERENTASAFVAAGNRSYYGIETDVHRTADGKFIIIHDDSTKRVCGDNLIVEESRFDTLRRLQVQDMRGGYGRADLVLPSLQEYAGICRYYDKVSVLELKNHFEREDIEKIIGIVADEQQLENTVFISFDLPNMITLRDLLPGQKLQYLTRGCDQEILDILTRYQLDIDVKYPAVTQEMVDELHSRGIVINCWTVNDPADAERLAGYGVDFITTNILEQV